MVILLTNIAIHPIVSTKPMMHLFTDPLQYAFIQRALIASLFVGVTCSLLGVYVVLRRMSNIGHALTHSALPGIVLAFITGFNLFIGAMISTMITALGIGIIAKDVKVHEDTAIGMMPTVMFAIGVLLISITHSYRDMSAMLFGNILSVTDGDIVLIAVVSLIIIFTLILLHKELKLFCVDVSYARMIGINVAVLRYGLLLLLSLAVVIGIQAVGTVLTNALLIIPVATARFFSDRFKWMLIISISISVAACIMGVYVSYYWGVSSGACIVLCCAAFFIIGFLYRRFKIC